MASNLRIQEEFAEDKEPSAIPNTPEPDAEKFRRMVRDYLDTSTAQRARQRAEQCRDYYDSKQWTEEEKSKLRQRGQPPIVFNRIKRKVDSVLGVERRQRTDPKAYGRTPAHEEQADIATQGLRYVADKARLNVTFSNCFENGLIEGSGAAEVIVTPNGEGGFDIEINQFPWDTFIVDPRSRKYDYSDARFMGDLRWMDVEDAAAMFPENAEALRREVNDGVSRSFIADDSVDDKPSSAGWVDCRSKRVQVCQLYYKREGIYYFGVVAGTKVIKDEPSYYLDAKGKPACPIEAWSAYIDRDLARYGIVNDMLGPQDEINHRRSKAVHFLHSRRAVARKGAVQDVEDAKRQLARPDGFLELDDPADFQVLSTAEETGGNLQMLQEAKNEIDQLGPNNALQGKNTESQSGRAILAQQQAGLAELAPLYDRFSDFKLRVYRAIWARIKQFWTAPMWIRVTDDPESAQFIGLNQPMMMVDEMTGQELPALDATGAPMLQNSVAEIDVDIIIDVAPDTVNIQGEEFEILADVLPKLAGLPTPYALALIEASSFPAAKKKQISELLQQQMAPPPVDPMAQRAAIAEIAGKEATALDKMAAAELKRAQVPKVQAETADRQMDAAKTGHDMRMDVITAQMDALRNPPGMPNGQ